jgi:ABC-2 type transport system permease protein
VIDRRDAIVISFKRWARALASIMAKDLKSTKRVPKYLIPAVVPTIAIFIVLFVGTVGGSPDTYTVLLVNEDHGLPASTITAYIENASNEFYPYFDVVNVSTLADARADLESYQYLGLIDIPAGFSANVTEGGVGVVQLQVQNINSFTVESFVNRMAAVVTSFNQHYNITGQGFALLTKTTFLVNEVMFDIRGFTIGAITLSAMLCGLFFGSMNVAKEYEDGTIVEVMNSPVPRTAFIASKQIIGVGLGTGITGLLAIFMYLATGLDFIGDVLIVIAALALTTLIHTSLGVLIGLRFKQTTPVIIVAILSSIIMYLFTGGAAPLKLLGPAVETISKILPGTYWNDILWSESLAPQAAYVAWRLLVLCGFAAGITVVSWIVMQKRGFRL